jgi:GT2 family glycosyltransferase
MTDAPSLAIVLINYNNDEDTIDCLDSLSEQSTDDFTTIVVDNDSEDESYERVRERFSFPVYIRNEANRGFTGGNNPGIEHALDQGVEYVLLLNNDTVVSETFVEDLLEAAEDVPEAVGVMGPTVHTYDSDSVWSDGGTFNKFTGSTHHRIDDPDTEPPRPVDYVVGAALMARAEVFEEVGLLDDDFFIYYEETEFCHRARQHGWEVWHVPVEGVYHKETTEFSHSAFRDYYFTRNRFLFVRKTQGTLTLFVFLAWYSLRWILAQTVYLSVTGNGEAAAETLRGGVDAFRGRTGRGH